MRRFSLLLLPLAALNFSMVTACSGGGDKDVTDPGTAGDDDDDTTSGDDDDDTTTTYTYGDSYFPVEVWAMSFDGVITTGNEVTTYNDPYGDPVPSLMILTYASEAYLQTGNEENCFVAWDVTGAAPLTPFTTDDGDTVYQANTTTAPTDLALYYSDCGDLVDPAINGDGAQDLVLAWADEEIGFGYGPLTTDMEALFAGYEDLMPQFGTQFFVIQFYDGPAAVQMSYAGGFEIDGNGDLAVDANDYLVGVDKSAWLPTAPIEQDLYLRGSNYWFYGWGR